MNANQVIVAVEHATAIMYYFHKQVESNVDSDDHILKRAVEDFCSVSRILLPPGKKCESCNGTGSARAIQ